MPDLKKGDLVRVKLSAYAGSAGKLHNGRHCKVMEIRQGDVITRSIDGEEPMLVGTRHSPHVLEKRK